MKKILFFWCISILMLAGCASSPKITAIDISGVGDKGMVKLHRSLSPENQPVNMDYGHPHDFASHEIGAELDLLVLRKFKWGKYGLDNKWIGRPVFPALSREKLIAALASAFNEATRSDRIAFNVSARKNQLTTGEVFINKENQLVWIFETIDGFPCTGKDRYWLDDADWTIEEKTGLTVKEYKNDQIVKVIRDLSIGVEDIVHEEEEERAGQARTEKAISPGLKGLEEKLQSLKRWKEDGLIDEKDYQKKKDELLQQLQ